MSNSFVAEQNQNKSTEDSEAALEEKMLSQIEVYKNDEKETKTELHMTDEPAGSEKKDVTPDD